MNIESTHQISSKLILNNYSILSDTSLSHKSSVHENIKLEPIFTPTKYSTHDQPFSDCNPLKSNIMSSKVGEYQKDSIQNCGNQVKSESNNAITAKKNSLKLFLSYGSHSESLPSSFLHKVVENCKELSRKFGVHSVNALKAAGFRYTNVGDTARCDECQLEVSNWTPDMNPYSIHLERSPGCVFIHSMRGSSSGSSLSLSSSKLSIMNNTSLESSEQSKPGKVTKIETSNERSHLPKFIEAESLKRVRIRTFSHWPHQNSSFRAQMIDAGFFFTNVSDRVICLYCNLTCQQWIPKSDDPWEVHKTLSPKCRYVVNMLVHRENTSRLIMNKNTTSSNSSTDATAERFRSSAIVSTAACHTHYAEIPKRHATFVNWPNEALPNVDDLVRSGFFYTGVKTIVTCFYCNGSLQNWGANDNPTIEHARWFPHCPYVRQLCGETLYWKIQESKRVAQERSETNDQTNNTNSTNLKLQISDESTLSRLVAARLDLPISQRLLGQNFKLLVIKRCWEDQLRLKQNDFETDSDLFVACTILQKQIDHINGRKENIIVPSVRMRQIRERTQEDAAAASSSSSSISPPTTSLTTTILNTHDTGKNSLSNSSNNKSNLTASVQSSVKKVKLEDPISMMTSLKTVQTNAATLTNPCVECMNEERQLACIPCGHLVTCVTCGGSLRSCPICRREIEAFVRIYM